jgi:sugar/nucleoside kinase (ribokinase family)
MRNQKVLIVADPAVDMYMSMAELEEMQIMSASPESRLFAGGTGGNTAGALAKTGVPTAFFGAVGTDAFGKFFKEELARIGVDVAQIVEIDGAFTLLCTVAALKDGRRFFSIYPAKDYAAGLLDESHRRDDFLEGITWMHASGSCLSEIKARETLLECMRLANKKKIPISLDLNLRPREDKMPKDYLDSVWKAIRYSTYVLGSADEEFFPLTGIENAEEAAKEIGSEKKVVIARLGEKGSLAVLPSGECLHADAFQVKVVDTLGAGDVYDAGFIFALLKGEKIHDAIRWGNALAASSIASIGSYRNIDLDLFYELRDKV